MLADSSCPICGEGHWDYLFIVRGLTVVRCNGCGLVSLTSAEQVGRVVSLPGAENAHIVPTNTLDDKTERQAAQQYLRVLSKTGAALDRLLLIAPEDHPFAEEARLAGYQLAAHVSIDRLDTHQFAEEALNSCVIIYQLEQAQALARALEIIWTGLKQNGVLIVMTPCLDAWPARFFGSQWTEWRPENHYYFSTESIQALLLRFGFEHVWLRPDRRSYTLEHIYRRAAAFPASFLTRSISALYRFTPPGLRHRQLTLTSSGLIVTAHRTSRRLRPLVSIIVPAYNEAPTFQTLMDALLAKQLSGADKEIIIVESNSQDNTRELARRYADHPEVRLILQDRPRGKGNAVRAGLDLARGDVIMIQDADLEYDLNDYGALLEPALSGRAMFVLGARHGGAWKMRQFTEQPARATFLNFGHVLFTTLLNLIYGGHMRDPFTMFKVFRRDCLYRVRLECNRFDFDFELVGKLLRKGYRPLEVSVNYRSRSFREGKKVSLFRDPITWIRALVKYRIRSPYVDEE